MLINVQNFQNLVKNSTKNIDPKFIKAYRTLVNLNLGVSFSGFGEDNPLLHILQSSRGLHPGFYVDLGAFHPIAYSNTFLLHLLGWRGINIDANEDRLKAFKKFRPKDINVSAGVSDKEEILTFYDVGVGLGSSFHKEWVEDLAEKYDKKINSAKAVQCYNINDLLEKHLPEGTRIDVLDIDIEGHDELVIDILDWEKYKPSFVLLEQHEDHIGEIVASASYKKLIENGYQMVSYINPTGIFKYVGS